MPLAGHLGFGIMPAMSTTLGSLGDYIADDTFETGDRLLAVDGQKVRHHWDIPSIEEGLDGREANIRVIRDSKEVHVPIQPTLHIKDDVFFPEWGHPGDWPDRCPREREG
jgi:hypothetical protein